MEKLIKIMLITFLVFSNVSISPTSAKEVEHSETSEVKLYLPNSDDLVLYEESELKEELTHVQNNSPALLLETDEETNSSFIEIELNEEKTTGYVQTEAVVEQEEYKLYTEKKAGSIQIYSDDTLKEELYVLEEGTKVLANQKDLDLSIDVPKDYAFITLNPETEAIPKYLVDEINKVEYIQGFVKKENLISLEDEATYLEKRNKEKEEEEKTQEQTKEIEEELEKDGSEEKSNVVEKEKQKETNDSDNADESEKAVPKAEENSEPEVKENEINRLSLFRSSVQETQTSLLGHINSGNGKIYKKLGGKSFKAGSTHTNKVYYVKKQTTYGNELYYLLSLNSKATNNLGWMKASDVKVQKHTYINRTSDKLNIKGNGKGTRMAWGGKKDTIHNSMSSHKGKILHINMKETVGKTTWYRGKIAGKGANVWLKANQVEPIQIKETQTSLLGHINSENGKIYKTLGGSSFKAGETHTNKVYYVKKQAKYGNELYSLLSLNSKATNNLGWMKASDVKVQKHTYINRTSDKLSIKGNGKGTRMAWGGKKDTIHASMSIHKGKILHINMKETVGTTTWYRGKISGKGANVWLKANQVEPVQIKETQTNLLGHINSGNGKIYKTLGGSSFKAGETHTNKVYYVKKQAKYGNELFSLLSLNSKATNNLGWMKASDVKVQKHTLINRTADKLSIKGNGKGTRMAWGGKKDTIHNSMSSHKGKILHVNMKETVGTTTWYRGKIAGQGSNIWLKASQTQAVPTNSGQLIVLDAGHGGTDPGASRNGVVEKEVVLDVTLRAEKILKARGFRVVLTRSTDTFVNLSERSNIANRNNASSFLSIHANSGGGIGTETWWYNRNNAASSKRFAQVIQNAVVNSTQARDRGIKHGNLSVNRESNMTSALLEIGFVDSMTEAQQLKRPAYRNQIAIGIANGFDNYYR